MFVLDAVRTETAMKKLLTFATIFILVHMAFAQPTRVLRQPPDLRKQPQTQAKTQTQSPATDAFKFSETDFVQLATSAQPRFFVIGENCQSFTAPRIVTSFSINRYETTYKLWYKVRIEAEANGYVFKNPGQEGSNGRRGYPPRENGGFEPVTMINWYDAVVWCNALSEREGRTPCYTYKGKILRDSSDTASLDLCECNWKANGYRLPTETEWEYAARYTSQGFQRGDLMSGQVEAANGNTAISENDIAWFDANTNHTREVGTTGSVFTGETLSGTGYSNGAGLFDMSGNVLEFCWDWFANYTPQSGTRATGPAIGAERVSRGGSWSWYTAFLGAGDRYSFDPNETYNYMGFRIATSN